MARLSRTLTLQHRAALGEAPESVTLESGSEVEVARDWGDFVLIKDAMGRRFSVPRDVLELPSSRPR